jgi:hypothetical protein
MTVTDIDIMRRSDRVIRQLRPGTDEILDTLGDNPPRHSKIIETPLTIDRIQEVLLVIYPSPVAAREGTMVAVTSSHQSQESLTRVLSYHGVPCVVDESSESERLAIGLLAKESWWSRVPTRSRTGSTTTFEGCFEEDIMRIRFRKRLIPEEMA